MCFQLFQHKNPAASKQNKGPLFTLDYQFQLHLKKYLPSCIKSFRAALLIGPDVGHNQTDTLPGPVLREQLHTSSTLLHIKSKGLQAGNRTWNRCRTVVSVHEPTAQDEFRCMYNMNIEVQKH